MKQFFKNFNSVLRKPGLSLKSVCRDWKENVFRKQTKYKKTKNYHRQPRQVSGGNASPKVFMSYLSSLPTAKESCWETSPDDGRDGS